MYAVLPNGTEIDLVPLAHVGLAYEVSEDGQDVTVSIPEYPVLTVESTASGVRWSITDAVGGDEIESGQMSGSRHSAPDTTKVGQYMADLTARVETMQAVAATAMLVFGGMPQLVASVQAVADQHDITPQAVMRAIHDGRVRGWQSAGRTWLVDVTSANRHWEK